jgi:CheY-like chemotaxis protein
VPVLRGKLVLVVEDDTPIRSFVAAALAFELGVRVVAAGDGAEALDRVAQQRPDLVLTDLRMPVMDGLALTRRLKADPATRAIPVVLMTAVGDRADAAAAGCDAFLPKPFELDELAGVVRHHLDDRPR